MFKILFSCFFPHANVMLWKSRMMTVRPIPRKKVFARLSHDRISTAYNMKNTICHETLQYYTWIWVRRLVVSGPAYKQLDVKHVSKKVFSCGLFPKIKLSSIVWNPRTNQTNPHDWRKRLSKKVFSCSDSKNQTIINCLKPTNRPG